MLASCCSPSKRGAIRMIVRVIKIVRVINLGDFSLLVFIIYNCYIVIRF